MKKKIGLIVTIICCIFTFVVLIPFTINILYKYDLGIWVLQCEWSAGEILGFYGALLSGALTVIGVLLTIKHETAVRKKDESITYKPIIELVGHDMDVVCGYREVGLGYGVSFENSNNDKLRKRYLESQTNNLPKYKLFFQNVGRGETYNAVVKEYKVRSTDWEDISGICSNIAMPLYVGEIIKDAYLGIYVKLPDYLLLPKEKNRFFLSTELHIEYSDMFNRVRYEYGTILKHQIDVVGEEAETPLVCNSDYHYVKVSYKVIEVMPTRKICTNTEEIFEDRYLENNKY